MDGLIAYVLSKGYTDEQISALGSVLTFKGVVDTYEDLPASGNKQGDVWSVRDTGIEYVWITDTGWEVLGSTVGTGKYTTTITGDGTTTSFTITHNLGTRDTATLVYGADYAETLVNIVHTSANVTTITFGTAPTASETYTVSCLVPQGPTGPKGDKGDTGEDGTDGTDGEDGFSPVASVSKTGTVATITITDSTHTTTATVSDGTNSVSVAATGTSTNEVKYITIDGVESKLGADGAWYINGTATSASEFTVDKTKSEISAALTAHQLPVLKMVLFGGNESVELPLHQYKETLATLIFDTTALGNNTTYQLDLNANESTYSGEITAKQLNTVSADSTGTSINKVKYLTIDANEYQLATDVINNVTSTDTDVPLSANMGKELQDQISNLKNIGRFLAIWNSATGLPLTNPTTLPYSYKTGDYYRVGTVAASGSTNYKPNGATYTGDASTTVESESVEVGWVYYYDGSSWLAQSAGGGGTVQDVQVNGTSILDLNSGVANIPLASASASGVMTSTQYTKLDGIEAGAEVNTVDSVDGETGAVVLSDVKYTTQTLTSAQQLQARTNIGAGTPYTVTVDI